MRGIEKLTDPRGLGIVDKHQQNPAFPNVFAIGVRVAIPRVRLLKLNSDEAPDVSAGFGITGIPTLPLLRHGCGVARISGATDSQQIAAWTRSALQQI